MAWTDEMVEDLKRMWHEGLTTGEIGKRLGVSKNSIVGKVHRLNLSGRPSPIKKKEEDGISAQPQKPKEEKKAAKSAPAPEPEAKLAVKESIAARQESRSFCPATEERGKSGKTMLTDLDNHTCRWPLGDPKDENFHFCGKKVKIGQTYCEEHANIAYVKTNKK